ncbi:DoxX family protein [Sulfuriflexus mobilis]|uniref:HvfX family Cu-binding RiPP maturation protein n=1 Tax=Sulfuriflexus mobilis TaxID=1811807 RepID=UPI000F84D5A6|nr:DoxX family protein [Sulfuriflexus mobilis]
MGFLCQLQQLLDRTRTFDFLGPLAMRLYLAPIFWMAGMSKFNAFEDTAAWFGNPDWGLGLPAPELMTFLAMSTEMLGAIALLIGLGVRWFSIPLMFTMLVAMFSVHWGNGWQAIADAKFCLFNCADANAAAERLAAAKELLQQHGNYDWLTEQGGIAILNNGIEFGATYFIMLLVLFFIGSGKYVSVDYWLGQKCK